MTAPDRPRTAAEDHASWGYTNSTGLGFTHRTIVDAHFAACAAPYRAALEQVGIRPGWHVLDAGCGSGLFLPWLTELVGPGGRVSAVDLAEENAALAADRVRSYAPDAEVSVRQADILDLPYADDTFDAVWCANTTQYLSDRQLALALLELRRVVRPGGLVAVKDLDATLITARPGDPSLFTDFFRRAAPSSAYARQLLRTRELHHHLADAGLDPVRRQTVLIEHLAPMEPAALYFYAQACARIAQQAVDLDPAAERQWAPFADPDAPDHPLRSEHGYISEGNTVAVGTVPPTA